MDWTIFVLFFTTHFCSKISIILSLASFTFSPSISASPVFCILPYLSMQIFASNQCF